MSAGSSTATALIRAPAWLTTWAMSYRLSMRGLTISARWPAISARRRRRINSSLLPLNIGPQTTSSQPPLVGCVLITARRLTVREDVAVQATHEPRSNLVRTRFEGLRWSLGSALASDRGFADGLAGRGRSGHSRTSFEPRSNEVRELTQEPREPPVL